MLLYKASSTSYVEPAPAGDSKAQREHYRYGCWRPTYWSRYSRRRGNASRPDRNYGAHRINDDLVRLSGIVHDRRATLIVAGLPISINGTLGPQAKKTQRFLERLEKHTEIQVETMDERYSSSEASRLMQAAGIRPSQRRDQVDSTAAVIILQAYLDQRASQAVPPPLTSGV